MTADELVRNNNLSGAIQALSEEVRNQPSNARRRTFLFELLCFAGQYDRADKHLNLLAEGSQNAELGGLLYRSALVAERKRQALFESRGYLEMDRGLRASRPGTLNGKPFQKIEDLDPRIGPRLEMFVAGEYLWLPFEHIGSIHMGAPKLLRDTLWPAATIQTSMSFKGQDFGEVLVPALSPFSWKHESDQVKLGRLTEWKQEGDDLIPFGQKLLIVDDEEVVPILDVRELEFVEVPQAQALTQQIQ